MSDLVATLNQADSAEGFRGSSAALGLVAQVMLAHRKNGPPFTPCSIRQTAADCNIIACTGQQSVSMLLQAIDSTERGFARTWYQRKRRLHREQNQAMQYAAHQRQSSKGNSDCTEHRNKRCNMQLTRGNLVAKETATAPKTETSDATCSSPEAT